MRIGRFAGVVMVLALVLMPQGVQALTDEERDQRREERRLEREQRRAEREARREQRRLEREQEKLECKCRTKLKLVRPSFSFENGVLTVTPRVDVSVKTKGPADKTWSANLDYVLQTSEGGSSSGQMVIGNDMICGIDVKNEGMSLGSFSLGLVADEVEEDEEVSGYMDLQASLSGCGEADSEHRMFDFELGFLGDLDLGRWRKV